MRKICNRKSDRKHKSFRRCFEGLFFFYFNSFSVDFNDPIYFICHFAFSCVPLVVAGKFDNHMFSGRAYAQKRWKTIIIINNNTVLVYVCHLFVRCTQLPTYLPKQQHNKNTIESILNSKHLLSEWTQVRVDLRKINILLLLLSLSALSSVASLHPIDEWRRQEQSLKRRKT